MSRSPAARSALALSLALLAALVASPVFAEPGANASDWKLGYYTPSTPGTLSMATVERGDGAATFGFTSADNTALLVTDHGSSKGTLLGDLTGDIVSARFTISDAIGAFTYYGQQDGCGRPASVRLFFQTDNSGGFDPAHYWWSNPEYQVLANGTYPLTAQVVPDQWSDWNGKLGTDPVAAAGFVDAAAHVTSIGFSFGGGCFFENGVGTTDGSGNFQLNTFTVS